MTGRRKLARQFRGKSYLDLQYLRDHYKAALNFYRDALKYLNEGKDWSQSISLVMFAYGSTIGGQDWYPPKRWIDEYKNHKRACREAVKYYNARYSFLDDVLASAKYDGELPQPGVGILRTIWSD